MLRRLLDVLRNLGNAGFSEGLLRQVIVKTETVNSLTKSHASVVRSLLSMTQNYHEVRKLSEMYEKHLRAAVHSRGQKPNILTIYNREMKGLRGELEFRNHSDQVEIRIKRRKSA